MSLHDMSVFAACIYYIVTLSSVETPSRRFVFADNSFFKSVTFTSSYVE